MKFLFVTIQGLESDFYARVGAELTRRGHDIHHLTHSARAARRMRAEGISARCLAELADDDVGDLHAEAERIERHYHWPTIRDVYRTDPACVGRAEEWCIRRTVQHFRSMERLIDDLKPAVLVPEVGVELIRTVAHVVALDRGVRTLFLFYTIFPKPLRLCVDTMEEKIADPGELQPLRPDERAEVERFVADFTTRARPIRAPRRPGITATRLLRAAEYTAARFGDRNNDYLRPGRWALGHAHAVVRAIAARTLTSQPDPSRPFVYFPLHLTEDYKIARVVPHCADQASIAEQIADALPQGYDLVVKEHPLSIGRNSIALLRRLTRRANVRLVPPGTSSHRLIRDSAAVAVISSTVGLEALLYEKPVLTLGRPYYAGYGLTLDVDSFADIRELVPAVLRFRPDRERILSFLHAAMTRCYDGAPVLVDDSDENAAVLAGSLDAAARKNGLTIDSELVAKASVA